MNQNEIDAILDYYGDTFYTVIGIHQGQKLVIERCKIKRNNLLKDKSIEVNEYILTYEKDGHIVQGKLDSVSLQNTIEVKPWEPDVSQFMLDMQKKAR